MSDRAGEPFPIPNVGYPSPGRVIEASVVPKPGSCLLTSPPSRLLSGLLLQPRNCGSTAARPERSSSTSSSSDSGHLRTRGSRAQGTIGPMPPGTSGFARMSSRRGGCVKCLGGRGLYGTRPFERAPLRSKKHAAVRTNGSELAYRDHRTTRPLSAAVCVRTDSRSRSSSELIARLCWIDRQRGQRLR